MEVTNEVKEVVKKHGLFNLRGNLCIPKDANYGAICDDFEAAGCPVVIFAGRFDYVVPQELLPEGWQEGDYNDID